MCFVQCCVIGLFPSILSRPINSRVFMKGKTTHHNCNITYLYIDSYHDSIDISIIFY